MFFLSMKNAYIFFNTVKEKNCAAFLCSSFSLSLSAGEFRSEKTRMSIYLRRIQDGPTLFPSLEIYLVPK